MSIERFTVLGLLGMGGQANIYLGTCNDSLLAFKCFNKPFKEDFEAALLLGLLEDRVIKPLGISIESSFPGIVTEYVPGSNLRLILNFLAEHELKFPFHAVLYLAQEIIFVLTSIHAQGIIHNDLSPANILLKPDGSLKLCDLGSASITGRTRSFGPAFGKKDYMALELLFDGEPSVSSDYYALGTIIFELLTG
ncbi:MAG TPA: protein kinase, partial [Myxococcota bacterium]|nr:protein kinase [Myxococcota bacterium]